MPALRGVWGLGWVLVLAQIGTALEPEPLPAPTAPAQEVFTIDRVTELALSNSPVLRQARARVEQMQGLAIQAGLYPNPIQNSGNPHQLGGNNSLYSVGFSQEFVRAGKLQLNRSAAEQGVRQANLELLRQRYDLLTNIRQQFFMLLATQQRVETLQKLREIAKQSEKTAIELKEGEQGSETDVLLLRIELRRVETLLRSAEYFRTASAQQLAALMGLPKLTIRAVQGNISMPLPDFDNPQEREQLLMTSSLVESARTDIVRNQFLLRRAEVEPIPNITLNSGYQWSINQPHSQALVGVYFTVPIWDRNQGNIRAAGANVGQSMAQLNIVQNDLIRQLAEALGQYRAAQQAVESYEKGILPDARHTLILVQRGWAAGQFDLMRLLQAQRSLFETNLEYITALQERLNAAASIAGLLQLDQFP